MACRRHQKSTQGRSDSRRGRSPSAGQLPDSTAASGPCPVHSAVARETLARVQLAVARLPTHLRESLLLRTQEGLAYADIARELQVSFETVRTHVARARAKTDTASQVDLVRLVLRSVVPALRPR